MGGRGGSGRSSAAIIQVPVVDAAALADLDIRDAYDDALAANPNAGTQSKWVSVERMRTALSVRGWDRERQDEQLLRFVRQNKGTLAPFDTDKLGGAPNRKAAIMVDGDPKGMFRI